MEVAWTFDAAGRPPAPASDVDPVLKRSVTIPVEQCAVCWDDIKTNLAVPFHPCSHKLCRPCTIQHFRTSMVPGASGVTCPVCADTGGFLPEHNPTAAAATLRRQSSATALRRARTEGAEGGAAATGAVEASPVTLDLEATPAAGAGAAPAATAAEALPRADTLRPVFGRLTEPFVRRLHAWSVRPSTKLPPGVRALTTDDVLRFVRASVEAAVREAGSGTERVVACPAAACGALLVLDDCATGEVKCPHCRVGLCARCGVGWAVTHVGRTCAEVKAQTGASVMEQLLMKRQGATFKPCPGCKALGVINPISHLYDHGCHHMRCPDCYADFCFYCGYGSTSEEHGARGCPTYCDDMCGCPPCEVCYFSGGRGCDMCSGECLVCTRLQRQVPLYIPGEEPESRAFWRDIFEEHAEDEEAVRIGVVASGKELGHYGEWRDLEASEFWCSVPGLMNGGLCDHGKAVLEAPHWSCCGALSRGARCSKLKPSAAWRALYDVKAPEEPPVVYTDSRFTVGGTADDTVVGAAALARRKVKQAGLSVRIGDQVRLSRAAAPDGVVLTDHLVVGDVVEVDRGTRMVMVRRRPAPQRVDPGVARIMARAAARGAAAGHPPPDEGTDQPVKAYMDTVLVVVTEALRAADVLGARAARAGAGGPAAAR